ncbi:hypothetical protein S7711_00411 [Stachybotrys chartarum IBT 7711]|uniref:Atos-like conserved domain-containing protein n=1 Tax=Stachybotrys chartarum (strain CBS 109288 / IBT 7711) TaxID=1280523 RepID=A0A084B9M5_STACB|nr:hypothetical protein S7711_00411 [Stachybotrys chartarum IBT 7711]
MPIFQDDIEPTPPPPPQPPPPPASQDIGIEHPSIRFRRLSEESLRTELCEGPVPDSPPSPSFLKTEDAPATPDRAELIQRLKRAQDTSWIPERVRSYGSRPGCETPTEVSTKFDSFPRLDSPVNPATPPRPTSRSSASLLPPAQITPKKGEPQTSSEGRLEDGLNIERPRSALHSGDFTHDAPNGRPLSDLDGTPNDERLSYAGTWAATSPPRHFEPFPRGFPSFDGIGSGRPETSPLSSSLSSFVYQFPTSPLVQSESNDELNLPSTRQPIDMRTSWDSPRRHTLHAFGSPPRPSPSPRGSLYPRTPLHRREGSLPYQAHQPRRSLTSTPSLLQYGTPPRIPVHLRSRRQSSGSDSSPIQRAAMVGSYEESILRGRMSTGPSKPLEFVAQIGVLGKGDCKPSLRCPPHVTLPFPAVYYSYKNTPYGRSQDTDGPSPYVGNIDLENGLPNLNEDLRSKRKAQSRHSDKKSSSTASDQMAMLSKNDHSDRSTPRSKRRVGSPKAPPGGSYRIPEKGQIQIVLKNPNKTAVKLFLVPYDLSGMEPGTKTWIRQRSHSTGPIVDNVPANTPPLHAMDRPLLRYLIHLHICSPSSGRYYLYKNIRVVFANRVPDGKEKLQNETLWQEPRFSPYKHVRVMHPTPSESLGPGATLAADKAYRRRSLGILAGGFPHGYEIMDGIDRPDTSAVDASSHESCRNAMPVSPVPFRLPLLTDFTTKVGGVTGGSTRAELMSSPQANDISEGELSNPSARTPSYEKLNKGDMGYGGNAFNFGPQDSVPGKRIAEGLLSQRLRSLGMKGPPRDAEHE